jgi:hypothetical protein
LGFRVNFLKKIWGPIKFNSLLLDFGVTDFLGNSNKYLSAEKQGAGCDKCVVVGWDLRALGFVVNVHDAGRCVDAFFAEFEQCTFLE